MSNLAAGAAQSQGVLAAHAKPHFRQQVIATTISGEEVAADMLVG